MTLFCLRWSQLYPNFFFIILLGNGGHSYRLPKDSLTPGETAVCRLLAKGLKLREAALALGIRVHTADYQLRTAYEKLVFTSVAG